MKSSNHFSNRRISFLTMLKAIMLFCILVTTGIQSKANHQLNSSNYYNIYPADGLSSAKKYLNASPDGRKVSLTEEVNPEGRQDWEIVAVPGKTNIYHIMVRGGISAQRKYLNAASSGDRVSLMFKVDPSGRQTWEITPVPGKSDVFHIQIPKNAIPGRRFLSCTANGTHVDIYSFDDNSGRQQWRIPGFKPQNAASKPSSFFNIYPADGLSSARKYLIASPDGRKVSLAEEVTPEGRQDWEIVAVPGKTNIYHIMVRGGISAQRKYLNAASSGDRVSLMFKVDPSGRQTWEITPVPGKSDVFHIQIPKNAIPGRRFLSCTANGTHVDIYSFDDKSGRQQWRIPGFNTSSIQTVKPEKPATPSVAREIPELRRGLYFIKVSKGVSTSDRSLYATSDRKSLHIARRNSTAKGKYFNIDPIPGKPGFYYIFSSLAYTQTAKYLGASQDGFNVQFYDSDDNSGRQQWRIEKPKGKAYYHIYIENGLNSGKKYLSCTADGTHVDLYSFDDKSGRQQWYLDRTIMRYY